MPEKEVEVLKRMYRFKDLMREFDYDVDRVTSALEEPYNRNGSLRSSSVIHKPRYRGEVNPEFVFSIAQILRGMADTLEDIVRESDLLARAKRKAKKIEIREVDGE